MLYLNVKKSVVVVCGVNSNDSKNVPDVRRECCSCKLGTGLVRMCSHLL